MRRLVLTASLLSLACSSDAEGPADTDGSAAEQGGACDPAADSGETACAEGLSCEAVAGQTDAFVCGAPVEIRGMVFDATDESAIAGARVIVFDSTGAPVSDVAITDASGDYSVVVPTARDPDGEVASGVAYTLGCTAIDYVAYPSGVRPAIPVSGDDVMAETEGDTEGTVTTEVIDNPSTDIGLLPHATGGGVTISGTVAGESGGTLVVAEGLAAPAPSGVADQSGAYAIFNVPAGAGTVRGYRGDLSLVPEEVTVADADLTVDLTVGSQGTATVSGSVNIVNAPGGAETSVVLVPSSVFIATLERGPVPFGLRAPEPGLAPSISGGWDIAGVPAGTYKVLAAFENDRLVRDPDESIAGTDIVEISVEAGVDQTVDTSFKVTEALNIVGPGAESPDEVTGNPRFEWEDDSSEDRYELLVFDALGNLVWERSDVVGGSGTVSADYAGPALELGQYYQFRATSIKDSPQGETRLSRTEDLRGVFIAR